MKKTLAVVLALLVAFSMFGVAAAAADGQATPAKVTVYFMNGDDFIKTVGVDSVANFNADLFPTVAEKYEAEEKVDGETKTYRYTFKGWKSNIDGQYYYPGTFQKHAEAEVIILTAEYAKEDISGRQSFWNLVESIFARINLIFEYFATIFNF